MADEQQVFTNYGVDFGQYQKLAWLNWGGDGITVPKKRMLEITTLTFSYFPEKGGTVGCADIGGRDSDGNGIWRMQVVYVEPKKTVHLVFPKGLRLQAGGYVELGFSKDGPGRIYVYAIGTLVSLAWWS